MGRGCLKSILFLLIVLGIFFFLGKKVIDTISQVVDMSEFTVLEQDEEEQEEKVSEWKENTETKKEQEKEEIQQFYYYEQLSKKEQKIYQKLLRGLEEYSPKIRISGMTVDDAGKILKKVLKDHPEIFWCDGSYRAVSYRGLTSYVIIKPQYLFEKEEKEAQQEKIEKVVDTCLKGIKSNASDYEKIRYVYEYIVNSVEYDSSAEHNQTIYSVFVDRRSVCAGYAKATQYLLHRLDVFCTYVTGEIIDSGDSHAWNLVCCDGDYYYVDTTWGDPVFRSSQEQEIQNINYDYLCCNDEELFRTHKLEGDIRLPACTEMKWNYYVVNHMYYTKVNAEQLLRAMNEDIRKKRSSTTFKFADEDLYDAAHKLILEDLIKQAAKNLGERYGIWQVRYSYLDEKEKNKIIIYWDYE